MGSATSILVSNNFIAALAFVAPLCWYFTSNVCYLFVFNEGKGNLFMVSYDDRPPASPYGRGLVSSFFFCVYLCNSDVERLYGITRADCLKISGVDPSQRPINSLKYHP